MNNKIYRILKFLKEHKIENAFINDDYTVDIIGNVDLSKCGLHYMPIKFNNVTGNFDCSYNNLTSLKNCPKKVGGNFDCTGNDINLEEVSVENYKGLFLYNENENNKLLNAKCLSESKLLNENNIKDEIQKLESEIADLEKTEEELIVDNRWSNDPREEILKRRNRIKDVRDLLKTKRIELKELKRRASFYYIEDEELDDEDLPDDIYNKQHFDADVQKKLKEIEEIKLKIKPILDKIKYGKDEFGEMKKKYDYLRKCNAIYINNSVIKHITQSLAKENDEETIKHLLNAKAEASRKLADASEGMDPKVVDKFKQCPFDDEFKEFKELMGEMEEDYNQWVDDNINPILRDLSKQKSRIHDLENEITYFSRVYKNSQNNDINEKIKENEEYLKDLNDKIEYWKNREISLDPEVQKILDELENNREKYINDIIDNASDDKKDLINNALKFLKDHNITGFTFNKGTYSINVNGNVNLDNCELEELPVQFLNVKGSFSIKNNYISNLHGCPLYVGGDFDCSNNEDLESLEDGPYKVNGNFNCSGCEILDSLEYSPEYVGGDYHCENTDITSLNGIGEVNGEIYSTFKDVIKKKALKDYGIRNVIINDNGTINVNGSVILSNKELLKIPFDFNEVTGDFKITDNGLTSLEGCPRKVGGNFWCNNNPITSLNGGPVKVGGNYMCSNCKSLSTLDGAPISVGGKFYCQMNNIDDQEFEKLDPQVRGKLVN